MKKAACVKLLAAAIVVIGAGGKAEARSTSHEHHGGGERHASARSGHESHGAVREARGHEGRGSAREARGHEGRDTFREARGHEGRGYFRESRHGHAEMAGWQRYGRSTHVVLSGRSGYNGGYSYGGGGIQCVTFAREDSGIELSGNARDWWANAAGVYQRGSRPEPGSVLNFRANGHMPMGHVSVVERVVDGRTVVVDHANWGGPGAVRGGISRDISVVDVSPNNDWSAVRVGLGHSGDFGSIYPTYGFIYNRPDRGQMVASTERSSAIPAMNPAPRDLRGGFSNTAYDEVAEAPDSPATLIRDRRMGYRHSRRHAPPRYRHHGRY